MNRKHVRDIACGASLLALWSAPAIAAAPPQPAGDEGAGAEIVVTAQRREERLIDVPISITALNAEALSKAGVNSTLDLAKVTPGVVIPLYGAYVLPSIRGVSSNGSSAGDSSNVAVYVDGVYQASQSSQLADLPDVQSIQVLKGPQGSLYGQNAAGGAIIVDTIKPSFTWKGKANLGYGNFDDKTASGYVTGPLTDTFAFALSGAYRDRRGINVDLLRGGHDDGLRSHQIRGKLLWQPSEGTSLTLAAYMTRRADTGLYSGPALNGNSLGYFIANLACPVGLACRDLPLATKHHEFAMNPAPDSMVKTKGISLIGKFDIGDLGTLNTVTSYHTSHVRNHSDTDSSPVNTVDFGLNIPGHDIIQEVNFVSKKFDGLTITAGAFYLYKVEENHPFYSAVYGSNAFKLYNTAYPDPLVPIVVSANDAKYKKNSYAAYAELGYDITEQLTLTAAGRYAYEKAHAYNTPLPLTWRPGDALPDPAPDPRGAFTFKKFTPRIVLRYKPDNNNSLYASYSQGFKSGYVNTNTVNKCVDAPGTPVGSCIDRPVKPEVVDAYEVGYKGRIGSKLNIGFSAFHYMYKSIQVFVYSPGPPITSRFENAAAGRINGVEFNADLNVTPDVSLHGGASYLSSKYTDFPAATVYLPNGKGNTQTLLDVSGNRLMRTPKFTGNASINYAHKFEQGDVAAYLGGNYNSGISFDPNNRIRQKAYAQVDAELSYAPAGLKGARIVLWGKNLTNHDYLQSVLESQLVDAVSYSDPRTYGVRFEFTF